MGSYWFGQNWQQDQTLMDHDVSNPGYVGFGTNTTMEDEPYRTNITLEYCEKLYSNETEKILKTEPNGFCNVSFDNLLCWPPTPFNVTAKVKCFSEFYGLRYDDTQNATRLCSWDGTWTKSVYDNCTELDPFSSNVETQTNIYLIGYIISSITLAIAIFIFTYFNGCNDNGNGSGVADQHDTSSCSQNENPYLDNLSDSSTKIDIGELRCLRNIIHMNLMWSYLLTYCMWIIILIELNFRDHMAVTCVFVVTLLHYFHITTFFWMFVEGLYLYILVVRTLTRESFKLRVYALIGWGTPLFFIILWAVIKGLIIQRSSNDPSDACDWFRNSNIDYVFQAPTIIVLVVNIIFMISIMIVLVTKLRSANTLEIQQYRKAVKALAVLIPLLGVTYAITIYAPEGILDMLRSALLSIQGFMVALFYCFLNMEVQNTLKHHFENWKTKKSLGPSRLRSSSRSKDWSPRSRTESLRITEWTLVDAEDLEDAERRISQTRLHPSSLNHTKESLLSNHRKESLSNQSLSNEHTRRFSTESPVVENQQNLLGQGRKYASETVVNSKRDSMLVPPKESLLSQRKESLVNQPLLEQSEESPTSDSVIAETLVMINQSKDHERKISFTNLPVPQMNQNNRILTYTNDREPIPSKEVSVIINHKGESIIIPKSHSNTMLKA